MRKPFVWNLLATLLFAQAAVAADSRREPLIVFGAASLTDVLQTISAEYTKASGTEVKLSFAASSALAKQIESGAKADVFVSADQEWMTYLDERKLIDKSSRGDLLGNKLVLIAPGDSKVALKLGRDAPLAKALGNNGRLATGDPDSVPVGKYAKAALTSLNLWPSLESRIARADNVRVALMYVARGEAPLGIVYATDAAAEPKVRVVDAFPASSHPPITYPVATTTVAKPAAKSYVEYLRGPAARAVFEKAGFAVLATASTRNECDDFRLDVSRELEVLRAQKTAIGSASNVAASPKVAEGRGYAISLKPQSDVRFAVRPEKPTVADGSYAGLVAFTTTKDGSLRVGLSEAAWIDVLADNKPLQSTTHAGSHHCRDLRKVVQFDVKKGQSLLLQFSGSTVPALNLILAQ